MNLKSITIKASITPTNGLTTDEFKFDLSKSINPNAGNSRIFYRYDWESDGIFDKVYTDESVLLHRFLKPGVYKVTIEALDLYGQTDTTSIQVSIAQGYSKPHPQFKILPPLGNIVTNFVFDGSYTRDDEDSLNTLKFRWDWDGDGIWDTPFENAFIGSHHYATAGYYMVNLEVLDPEGFRNQIKMPLNVNLHSGDIKPAFVTTPAFIIQKESIVFDASSSVDQSNPEDKLQYRWDWENDGAFDTEWSSDPIISHVFIIEQDYTIKLEVGNSLGLVNFVTKTFEVNHKNLPPVAFFKTSSIGGNTKSAIRFDAWGSSDLESKPSDLLMRWDFNGDGIFDTDFAKGPEVFHRFEEAGEFPVTLEVKDDGGLSGTFTLQVYISSSDNQMDILLDKRGAYWEYYGIVRVGNQWWYSRNLSVFAIHKYDPTPYNNNVNHVPLFGYLYPRGVLDFACPDGWRVPSREDWDVLFAQFPKDSLFDCLKPGGRSDVNLNYGGYADLAPVPWLFSGINNYGFYWSTTKPSDVRGLSWYYVTIDKTKSQVITGFGGIGQEKMAIRCVKDN